MPLFCVRLSPCVQRGRADEWLDTNWKGSAPRLGLLFHCRARVSSHHLCVCDPAPPNVSLLACVYGAVYPGVLSSSQGCRMTSYPGLVSQSSCLLLDSQQGTIAWGHGGMADDVYQGHGACPQELML
ncbi:interleukin-17C [Platysternon megacephalum]|uniref:Interleukin-17C n=1 Tax=Platysternon megacephalum TaxID=55544 RepID=A0A4D9DRU6_9SAUR|nr:interleukin-17C [Platysternon megacephalum]